MAFSIRFSVSAAKPQGAAIGQRHVRSLASASTSASDQWQRRVTSPSVFFRFCRALRRLPVAHRGGGDQHVDLLQAGQHRVAHVLRAHHVDHLEPGPIHGAHRPEHHRHPRPARPGGPGDGQTHLPGAGVAQETNGIEELPGGPGGDQHVLAGEGPSAKSCAGVDDLLGLAEPPLPLAAGQ